MLSNKKNQPPQSGWLYDFEIFISPDKNLGITINRLSRFKKIYTSSVFLLRLSKFSLW